MGLKQLTGTRLLSAVYRCEHCGHVTLDPVMLEDVRFFRSGLTSATTERRMDKAKAMLADRMDRTVEGLLAGEPEAFRRQHFKGRCGHCQKKQAWMQTLDNSSRVFFAVCLLLLTGGMLWGAWSERHDPQMVRTTLILAGVFFLLALWPLVYNWRVNVRFRRIFETSPVLMGRSMKEAYEKVKGYPDYLRQLSEADLLMLREAWDQAEKAIDQSQEDR